MSCRSGRDYDASAYADTWTYVDKSLFGSKKLRKSGRSTVGRGSTPAGQAIYLHYNQFLEIQRRANTPVDPEPQVREKPQHKKEIKRFVNSKPTVQGEYETRMREATSGGGANARAYAMRAEQLDEVKTLKTQILAMEVKKSQDAQLKHKQAIAARELQAEHEWQQQATEENERRMYLQHQKEQQYRQECIEHAATLKQQREEGRQVKVLDDERKEQENKQIRAQVALAEKVEQDKLNAAAAAKRLNARQLKDANIRAQRYKRIERQAEEREDQKITAYNQRKAAEQFDQMQREAANAAEREAEIARLRELQEKSNDKRAAEDAKQAELYREQRLEREDAVMATQQAEKKRMLQQVLRERDAQVAHRGRMAEVQKREDEAENRRIRSDAQVRQAKDDAIAQQKYEARQKHFQELSAFKAQAAKQKQYAEAEIRNMDARRALDAGVYQHEVDEVFKQKLGGLGQDMLPKQFRVGAKEARDAHRAQKALAQKTRPLW